MMDIMSKISSALIVIAVLIALTLGDTPIFWVVMALTAVTLTVETVHLVRKWRKMQPKIVGVDTGDECALPA